MLLLEIATSKRKEYEDRKTAEIDELKLERRFLFDKLLETIKHTGEYTSEQKIEFKVFLDDFIDIPLIQELGAGNIKSRGRHMVVSYGLQRALEIFVEVRGFIGLDYSKYRIDPSTNRDYIEGVFNSKDYESFVELHPSLLNSI